LKEITAAANSAGTLELSDVILKQLKKTAIGKTYLNYLQKAGFVFIMPVDKLRRWKALSVQDATDYEIMYLTTQTGAFTIIPGSAVGSISIDAIPPAKITHPCKQIHLYILAYSVGGACRSFLAPNTTWTSTSAQ